MLRPAFLLVTVAAFFAFVSIGVVLPVLPRCTESSLGAGSVAVGIAVGAASMTALLSPSRPPGGSSGRDWGGYTVEEAALRHGAGVEEETEDPKQAYARFRPVAAVGLVSRDTRSVGVPISCPRGWSR